MIHSIVRFDRASSFKLGATPVEVRPNGWKVYEGTAGFGNIVQQYPDLTPPRAEFRPSDEALADATLASAEGVPLTWDHPSPADTPAGLLLPETTKDHTEGAVLRAWREEDKFRVRVIVYTPELQEEIEDGLVDLSLGYSQDLDETPGEFQGQRYDAVQRNIKVNHLAVVGRARARRPDGQHARLDQEPNSTAYPSISSAGKSPMKNRIDQLSDEAKALLKQMPEADQKLLAEATADEDEDMEPAGEEGHEDIEEDKKLLAPLEERLSALEALMKGVSDSMTAMKDSAMKKPGARSDASPLIDLDAVLAKAEKQAVARFNQSAQFVETVRLDGHKAVTTDDAAAVMLAVVKDHLPDLHPMALDHLKGGRLDSLSALYKSAEKIRRQALIQEQAETAVSAVRLDASLAEDAPIFILPQ